MSVVSPVSRFALLCASLCVAFTVAACQGDDDTDGEEAGASPYLGGETTVFDTTRTAYARPAANLDPARLNQFDFGHSLFHRNWVISPSTTDDLDGLGPLFNQRACSSCHSRDGRSAPFLERTGDMLGMLVRLSIPGAGPHGEPLGDPHYGTQFRPEGILKIPGAGRIIVEYTEEPGNYGDGERYSLRRPKLVVESLNYGPLHEQVMMSARVAPAVIGLGLLEAIPEEAILANVRHDHPDGVRGKANYVWSFAQQKRMLGRFGWKANEPTVEEQTAAAFLGDIGITSRIFPEETCTSVMTECLAREPMGDRPELRDGHLHATSVYMRTLAVPARRKLKNASALRGERLFTEFGCASCHVSEFRTGNYPEIPELSHQLIHPYTDLLLHDMGPDLADGRPDFEASGSEWRTPPLWGLGLLQTVNRHQFLLHDARARGIAEAILWHGGEGEAAKERFRLAPRAEREDLLTFLESL